MRVYGRGDRQPSAPIHHSFSHRIIGSSKEKRRANERTRTADLHITSWRALVSYCAIAYLYVAYPSLNRDTLDAVHPTVCRLVPVRLQQAVPLLATRSGGSDQQTDAMDTGQARQKLGPTNARQVVFTGACS